MASCVIIIKALWLPWLTGLTGLISLGLQNHCGRCWQPWNEETLAPWKKSYDQPRQHIKKQSHFFANKGPHSQSYGFSRSHVWMWELDSKESWAPKNWCFWTVVLEKTLESLLDSKEIQPSILKEISPGCSLEGLMLRLKLQYFWHLMWRADWSEKTLMLGNIEGRKRRGWQRMRWMDGIINSVDMVWVDSRSWWWTRRLGMLWLMGSHRVRHDWATELNLTEQIWSTRSTHPLLLEVQLGQLVWIIT